MSIVTEKDVRIPVNREQRRRYQKSLKPTTTRCPSCHEHTGFYVDTKDGNKIKCIMRNCDTGQVYEAEQKLPNLHVPTIGFAKNDAKRVQEVLLNKKAGES